MKITILPNAENIACTHAAHFTRNVRDRGYDAYRVTHPGETLLGKTYAEDMVLLIRKSRPCKVMSLPEFVAAF